ncbi:MAG TPA: DUF2062 domain-containing protein [Coleofasciculaceae cyanobacterium]
MSKDSLERYPVPLPSTTQPPDPKSRGSKLRFKRRLLYFYWRLVRFQGRPEALARGLACGVFVALFPILGLQTIVGVLLAVLLRGNKILAAIGAWLSNPLTYPVYAFNFYVGQKLLNQDGLSYVSLHSWKEVIKLGSEILWPLFVGCLVVGLLCAVFSYFLSLWLIRKGRASYQLRRKSKRLQP